MERIARLTSDEPLVLDDALFQGCADADQALSYLEQWLKASANPATAWRHLLDSGPLGRLLVDLLGVSHQLGDVLVQGPERANLILDPATLTERPTIDGVREEARRLLRDASAYRHRLDRLRYVRQGWMLRVAACDIGRLWPEEHVWTAISDVAEALLVECAEAVWEHLGGEGACPVAIVGMGKLGGRELNYSSDTDLVYVLPDEADPAQESLAVRFCEAFGRAVSDRMGRGALYRVDLRLRPFGGAGPIVSRMTSIEGYYERYAEPWECMALIRSKVLGGGALASRWEAMRARVAFPDQIVEWAVEGLIQMRGQVEEFGEVGDLKRGAGGIRDVEFLVQILQMLRGRAEPALRVPGTLPAIRAMVVAGVLDAPTASAMADGYTLLRQVEHRIQIAGDQQTHALPSDPTARDFLARSLGLGSFAELDGVVDSCRRRMREIWDGTLRRTGASEPMRRLDDALGRHAAAGRSWLDALGEPETYARAMLENADSLRRFESMLAGAPALVPYLHRDHALTEQVISGEIEEPEGLEVRLRSIDRASSTDDLARSVAGAWRAAIGGWVLGAEWVLGPELSRIWDAAARALIRLSGAAFDAIALGSWAASEGQPGSDLDVLFLTAGDPGRAEPAAEKFLAHVAVARRAGAPIEFDLRLRPEGRRGALVRSHDAFRAYEAASMEPWERLALTQARLVAGATDSLALVQHAAFGKPPDLAELRHMKRRIEAERVPAQHQHRNIKLGWGALDDIRWQVAIRMMRLGSGPPPGATLSDSLGHLASHGALNAAETEVLRAAHRFFSGLRCRLWALGIADDVLPENPNKLDQLAVAMGLQEGNVLLAQRREHAEGVRALFEEAWT